MDLSDADRATIRSHVGSEPSDADLNEAAFRLDSVEAVALEVLRGRLADMRGRAAKFTADGDYSEDWSANLTSLDRQVTTLETSVATVVDPDAGKVSVSTFVRAGRTR